MVTSNQNTFANVIICKRYFAIKQVEMFLWCFFQSSKVLAKKELLYVPLIGWTWYFLEIVFCKRKWEEDRDTVVEGLKLLSDYPEYMWVSFTQHLFCTLIRMIKIIALYALYLCCHIKLINAFINGVVHNSIICRLSSVSCDGCVCSDC